MPLAGKVKCRTTSEVHKLQVQYVNNYLMALADLKASMLVSVNVKEKHLVGLGLHALCNDVLTESVLQAVGSVKSDSDKQCFSTGATHARTICGAQGPFMTRNKWSPKQIMAADHLLRDRPHLYCKYDQWTLVIHHGVSVWLISWMDVI